MKFSQSDTLFRRAAKVIPSGAYGHTSPHCSLPVHFPKFSERASGYKFWDTDGNEWIDFMCGFGTVIHGYCEPSIENAVNESRYSGTVFNQPHPVIVELAESLTQTIDFADWAVFAKNGSDLTTWAIRVAREFSHRSLIIKASGSYHGVDAWCDPGKGGRIPSDRSDILEFNWNDLNQFEDLFRTNKDAIAGVILTPYHHPSFAPSVMPTKEFWLGVRRICDENGALLILDDVRAGWRLSSGGSHRYFGFSPDLAIYSKALGNGYSISACVGKELFKKAASEVFLTGSCWNDSSAMVAALQSLKLSTQRDVAKSVLRKGEVFCKELEKAGNKYGFDFHMTGPTSMPYPWFRGDDDLYLIRKFCELAAMVGLFYHPYHNWFISDSHSYESLKEAIDLSEKVFFDLSEKIK